MSIKNLPEGLGKVIRMDKERSNLSYQELRK